MAPSRRVLLGALPLVIAAASALAAAAPVSAYNCGTIPIGQANPSAEVEPLQPVWCLGSMAAEPTTRQIDRWGGWQDSFQTNVQNGHLNNGDMGYRVFDSLSNGSAVRTRHFVNNNHWMVDMSHDNGGAALSPNQAFHFENGRLVIEADVAASVPGFFTPQGDLLWPEVVWSTSPTPTAHAADGLYLYGHFGGQWAGGCRMHGGRNMVCALEADRAIPTNGDKPPCFSQAESRVFELSAFQECGTTHSGFAADFGAPKAAWRQCQPNQMDMYCRDRFRFEWSQSGFVAYVNGIKYAEDTGWPGYAQIPAAIASGQRPVYVYFGEWGDFRDANVYRFHWGRIAVNPHDANGSPLAPSAATSYCPGQVQSTCPMNMQAPAPKGAAAVPMPVMPDNTAPPLGATMPQQLGAATVHAYVKSLLNAGQQPSFWALLGLMLAGAAGVMLISWLWRAAGGSGSGSSGEG
jgi:hypothetical protein